MQTKKNERDAEGLQYRKATIDTEIDAPSTLREDDRSVEVIATTETPTRVYSWERGVVDEVLLMDGLRIPKKVPLLDTHDRYSVSSVLGSFRDIKVEGDKLVGRVYYSSTAGDAYEKVREGHLTDFSVGYRIDAAEWIDDGKTKNIKGRDFSGPLQVVKKWSLRELSTCPIGADAMAKTRMESTTTTKEIEMAENQAVVETIVDTEATRAEIVLIERVKERERLREIGAMCRRMKMRDDFTAAMLDSDFTVDEVRIKVMEEMERTIQDPQLPDRVPVTIVADEKDKYRTAAEGAILLRAGMPGEPEKAIGAVDLAGFTLVEMARKSLQIAGQRPFGDPRDVVGRAMTTSDFPYILANVAHKSLFAGWDTADETWATWCNTGSVSDFKTHYSPRIGEFSDLEEIPESAEYKHGSRAEAQESYSIVTYGKLANISRQAIINDDLNAITMNFFGMGEAAARKVGDLPYAVLTANANMGDNVALFHATHANFVDHASGGAPGVATIAAGILAMGSQKDLSGLRRLNIRPEYLLAPKALEGACEVFFRSDKFSDHSTVATDSSFASTRVNPYSGTYFTRVYEPRLDDDDTAAWYLAARKGKTVTVFFLNGVRAPYMEMQQGWTVDGTEYKVRIDAGAKAMNWNGLYFNDGN